MLTISSNVKDGRRECTSKMTGFGPSQIMDSAKMALLPFSLPLPLWRPWNPDLSGFNPIEWIHIFILWCDLSSCSYYLAELLVMKKVSFDPLGPNLTSLGKWESWCSSCRTATSFPKGRASSFARAIDGSKMLLHVAHHLLHIIYRLTWAYGIISQILKLRFK